MNPLWDDLVARHAGSQAPFLTGPGGARLSYDRFVGRAGRMAGALAAMGLAPGDRLVARLPRCADALALYAACLGRGVVIVPLNPAYTPAEMERLMADAGAAALICAPEDAPALRPLAGAAGARLETLGPDGAGTLAGLANACAAAPAVPRAPGDLAALLYTSGTTGRPKGAMLTQGNLLSNARALAALWRFGPADVLLHALPIFHVHGLFVAVNVTLAAGGSIMMLPRFDAAAMVRAMPGASAMMGVPTFYTRLLAEPGLRAAAAGMRLFVSGSAPLRARDHAAWEAATGHRILERYGMTETGMIASNPYDGDRRAGTVGTALPETEIRIRRADGALAAPGEAGGIEVRGPGVFSGYWRMPERTEAELTRDGWFATGDLGRTGPDGYLTILGRDRDLIITGGFNVHPGEVEEVLDAQPGVAESAVIGAPDADLGEAVLAVIVPDGDGPDMAALEAALAGVLARYKLPRRYAMVPDLPRNAMGKVQKAELRRRQAGAGAAPAG